MLELAKERLLITDGEGFIGRTVSKRLAERGCQGVLPVPGQAFDLRREEEVLRLFRETKPTVVVHCAGLVGGIKANTAAPAEFFYDNIRMNIFLVHYAHVFGLKKLVALGAACSYPKVPPSYPFKEEDLWEGFPEETSAPYAFAKKMLLVQTRAYAQQYGLKAVNLIPADLYGPGDNFDPEKSHVVPALVRKFVEAVEEGKKRVEVWGSGKASRDFLYIDDFAEAVVVAVEKGNTPEPINIGSGSQTTVRELVELLARLTDYHGQISWDLSRPDGQPRRCLDTSRAKRLLGFSATTSLEMGLGKTLEWYRTECLRKAVV